MAASAVAATTKNNHAPMARHGCWALQRAARVGTLVSGDRMDIVHLLKIGALSLVIRARFVSGRCTRVGVVPAPLSWPAP